MLAKKGELTKARKYEMYANYGLVAVGVGLGLLGVTMSLKSAGGGH